MKKRLPTGISGIRIWRRSTRTRRRVGISSTSYTYLSQSRTEPSGFAAATSPFDVVTIFVCVPRVGPVSTSGVKLNDGDSLGLFLARFVSLPHPLRQLTTRKLNRVQIRIKEDQISYESQYRAMSKPAVAEDRGHVHVVSLRHFEGYWGALPVVAVPNLFIQLVVLPFHEPPQQPVDVILI